MSKYLEKNRSRKKHKPVTGDQGNLKALRKRIFWQAGLTTMILILTVIIVFAISAAWTSNIVQTSGLQFLAEAWSVDQTVNVGTSVISASPGNAGGIPLSVENKSEELADVILTVAKDKPTGDNNAAMDKEMQKRLYFYVDTPMVREGEQMDRVYLNTRDSYTYVLQSGQSLTLTETSYNNAPLKWYWVYDMLGYYVYRTALNGVLYETEFLRPIEYTYDPAKIQLDDNGKLTYIDAKTTVKDFLIELSKKDGYLGTIDPNQKTEDGYYPVVVDEKTGEGIYAYLCSYPEIVAATNYDTNLGKSAANLAEGAEPASYTATMTITTQNHQAVVEHVATLEAMKEAMSKDNVDVIQLSGDIEMPAGASFIIPQGNRVTLDLNKHTIYAQMTETLLQVEVGAALAITNGTIENRTSNSGTVLQATGAEVKLDQVTLNGFHKGIFIMDYKNDQGIDSVLKMNACKLGTVSTAVQIDGNGGASETMTRAILENCVITSNYIGLTNNASATNNNTWGTDIQVINTTITGKYTNRTAAIYHPQKNSILTISGDSVISGNTGLVIKGGTVLIEGAIIQGKGTSASDPSFNNNGFAYTAAGIYIEGGYQHAIDLTVKSSDISSEAGYALLVFPDTNRPDDIKVELISGTFIDKMDKSILNAYLATGSVNENGVITNKQ